MCCFEVRDRGGAGRGGAGLVGKKGGGGSGVRDEGIGKVEEGGGWLDAWGMWDWEWIGIVFAMFMMRLLTG